MADAQTEFALQLARFFPHQGEWTEEAYFALPESTLRTELSEGRLIVSTPTLEHNDCMLNLVEALRRHVRQAGLGRAGSAPFDVRLWPGKIRQADVFFIRAEHEARIKGAVLDGPPDFAAEIISPGSRHIDEVEKFEEYARAGIPEYWLIDLENKVVRVFSLAGSAYAAAGTYTPGQRVHSLTIAGFAVDVNHLFNH